MSLSRFDFIITYWLEKQQRLSDALLRRSYLMLKIGEATSNQQCTTLSKPKQFRICVAVVPIDVDFLDQVRAATLKDSVAFDINQRVDDDKFKVEGELLYFEEQLYIPK